MLLPIELSEAALHFGSSLYLHHLTTFIAVQIKRYHLGIKITLIYDSHCISVQWLQSHFYILSVILSFCLNFYWRRVGQLSTCIHFSSIGRTG